MGKLARDKNWEEMPELITDEMLRAFAGEAAPDEVGPALRGRYEELTDRLNLYTPFVPVEKDGFWRAAVESMHASP